MYTPTARMFLLPTIAALALACGSGSDSGDGGPDGSSVNTANSANSANSANTKNSTSNNGGSTNNANANNANNNNANLGGPVGSPCTADEQCTDPADAECFTTEGGGFIPDIIFPGGFCSKPCKMDTGGGGDEPDPETDCGSIGTCVQMSTQSGGGAGGMNVTLSYCTIRCEKPEDCREGYRCHFVLPGFPGACVL